VITSTIAPVAPSVLPSSTPSSVPSPALSFTPSIEASHSPSTDPTIVPSPFPFISNAPTTLYSLVACGSTAGVASLQCKYHVDMYSRSKKIAVRCCSDSYKLNWIKHDNCNVWANSNINGCHKDKTWVQAKFICEGGLGRLCTVEEMVNDCTKNTGCDLDYSMVWTSTPPRPS